MSGHPTATVGCSLTLDVTAAATVVASVAASRGWPGRVLRESLGRDFAHLEVLLCRALGIPARFASVYAPGLTPMDFHAVFEAYVDGRWQATDATGMAPRGALVRISTGGTPRTRRWWTCWAGSRRSPGPTSARWPTAACPTTTRRRWLVLP